MKKFLAASLGLLAMATMQPAQAADMPVKAPVYKEYWSWSGFYLGVNIGYSWGRSRTDVAVTAPGLAGFASANSFNLNGVVGGGQAGINWQNGKWVLGIEVDIQGTGERGGFAFACPAGACNNSTAVIAAATILSGSFDQKLAWFSTLRGRLGVTASESLLLYVTGGAAFGSIDTSGTLSAPSAAGPLASVAFSNSTTKTGWAAGIGAEARLSGNWTGKLEYIHLDLGSVSGTVTFPTNPPPGTTFIYSSRITDDILRVGLNYKFGHAVEARY
jgi:outer membrane immunogenic protein